MDYAPHYVETTPELVHLAILKDAAEIANVMAVEDDRLPEIVAGGPFNPAPLRSRRGGLALALTPGTERMAPEKLAVLREVGVAAVHRSLMKNQREFVGLVLGHAKHGVNYFDRFRYAVGEQTELF